MRLTTCINIFSACFLSLIVPLVVSAGTAPPSFDSQNAMPRGNLKDLNFRSRIMVPYGPNLFGEPPLQTAQDRPWNGYGFGMGAGEELVYDTKEKYAYMGSAVGFVTVVDYQDPVHPKLTDYGISWGDELEEINDLAICPEQGWLFVSIASRGVIGIYKTIQRADDDTTAVELPLLKEVSINGGVPSSLLPNTNCTLLAVANENQGFQAYGTVTLLRDLKNIHHDQEPTQTNIPMDFSTNLEEAWDDDYVLRKGLHMPLTKNALEYWDEHSPIANVTDFTQVRNNYRSSLFLEGEFLAWASPDETELLVNLQTNNGLLRIDVNKNRALGLAGYGLKDHGSIPIDIDGTDKTCNLQTYPNLFALRSPDSIRTLRYNDKLYLLTANEGDDKGFEQYNEVVAAKELFVGEEFGLPKVRVPTNKMEHGALFNSNCQEEQDGQGQGCVGDVELSVGSTAIDYELDPANPTFQRMVLLGGRGWTIYELPENPDALLKLVFDSGADVERSVCEKYPWAYNAEVDEEYAPTDLMPNHTLWNYGDDGLRDDQLEKNDPGKKGCLDQGDGTLGACPLENNIDAASDSSGAQLEHVEAGVACGRLVAVVASEKNSVAWLYDITDITTPDLIKTFHLSPAIQSKSPGLAYNDGTIGEIDPENFIFLSKEESPSGKAAMLFGGAFSGTLSYWEFECEHDDNIEQQQQGSSLGNDTSSSSSDIIIPAKILSSLSFAVLMVWML